MMLDLMFDVIGAYVDGDIDRQTMFGFAVTLLEIHGLDEAINARTM